MVYADVVVGVRGSSEELTYAVPAKIIPYIRVGSLVTVPVRRRLIRAVVVKIHQRVDSTLKEKLREIYSIDKTHPGISPAQLETATNLAKKYLTNVSDVVFRWLTSLRPIATGTLLSERVPLAIRVEKPKETVSVSYLQGAWLQRIEFYSQQADKFQETLIIFPTNAHLESFLKNYSGKLETIALDGSARVRKKILSLRESAIFLGTVGDCFFPIRRSGLIIVDQPEHLGSKYSNRPYLKAVDVARERAKNEGLSLIVGQPIFSFSQIQDAQTNKTPLQSLPISSPEVIVVSRVGAKELLVESIRDRIKENISKKLQTVVFVASKGWSTGLFCKNCQQMFSCQSCARVIGADSEQLICRYCGYTAKKPNICLNCRRAELVEVGEGIDKYADEVKKAFPESSTQVVAGYNGNFKAGVDITLATEKLLSCPDAIFDELVIASADRALTGSILDDSWRLLSAIRELSAKAKAVVIQTYLIDHPVWAAVNPQNLRAFFASELSERKKYRLPPFTLELTLVGQQSSEKSLIEQLEKLEKVLDHKFPMADYSSSVAQVASGQFQSEISIILPRNVYLLAVNTLAETIEPNWTAIPS